MKKFLLGALFAPTAAVSLFAALESSMPLARATPKHLPFLAGFALYPVAHFLLFKPLRLYVFGHELTHAFAAVLSGVRVRRFVAGKESGHVVVDQSNVFIALAPYVIPIWSLLALGGFRLAAWWWPDAALRAPLLAVMGLTLAFHLTLTLDILTEGQKDLQQAGGTFFSLTVIALGNAVMIVALFKLLFPDLVSLRAFGLAVAEGTWGFWRTLGHAAIGLAARMRA